MQVVLTLTEESPMEFLYGFQVVEKGPYRAILYLEESGGNGLTLFLSPKGITKLKDLLEEAGCGTTV